MSKMSQMKTLAKINTLKLAAEETLWPTRCVICDVQGYLLCPKCAKTLSFIDHLKTCKKCGEPFGRVQCGNCLDKPPFDGCTSATLLDKNTGGITTMFKDSGELRLSKVMSYFMAKALDPAWYKNGCIVTFIPASKQAYNRRGFDHCEILANELSKRINSKTISLFRRASSQDQRSLSRRGRHTNIGEKYQIFDGKKDLLKRLNIPIIIVDDVYTTGATLYGAARSLKNLCTSSVYCVSFSRTF